MPTGIRRIRQCTTLTEVVLKSVGLITEIPHPPAGIEKDINSRVSGSNFIKMVRAARRKNMIMENYSAGNILMNRGLKKWILLPRTGKPNFVVVRVPG